jgi:hypothetical protein
LNYNKLGFLIMVLFVFSQSISIASEPFHMVVIGDSIAWGAGIEEDLKYYSLVRDWIAQEKDIPSESIELQVLAHTGATLFTENYDPERSPDLISGNPTISHQADMILNPDEVDLILVSGGINDIGVDNILRLEQLTSVRGTTEDKVLIDPINAVSSGLTDLFTGTPKQAIDDPTYPISKVQEQSSGIRAPMHLLLIKLLNKCPNARIVVTSYYPIISTDSQGLSDTILALVPKSKDIEDYKHLDEPDRKRQLIDKSGIFYTESTKSLRAAVNDANSDSGSNRVAFAQVVFIPINSYGADQTWLWRITNSPNGATIDDKKSSTRMLLLSTEKFDPDEYAKNKFAAVGHPNERGAIEYKERIINTISNTWPNWLKKPDSPSSPINSPSSSDTINELPDINNPKATPSPNAAVEAASIGTQLAPQTNTQETDQKDSSAAIQQPVPQPVNEITGSWVLNYVYRGDIGSHKMIIDTFNPNTGDFKGHGWYLGDPRYKWDITGAVNGIDITFHISYTGLNPTFSINATGVVSSAEFMSGKANDPDDLTTTWNAAKALTIDRPNWDITGRWQLNYQTDKIYSHKMAIDTFNPNTGDFKGHGQSLDDPTIIWDISGTVDGDNIAWHIAYTGLNPTWWTDATGVITSATSMSGKGIDRSRSGTWNATKT